MTEAQRIAESLTEAQRQELERVCKEHAANANAPSWSRRGRPSGYYCMVETGRPQVAAALYRLRLLDREEYAETDRARGSGIYDRWRFRWVYKPTPLGLQVRQYLREKEG